MLTYFRFIAELNKKYFMFLSGSWRKLLGQKFLARSVESRSTSLKDYFQPSDLKVRPFLIYVILNQFTCILEMLHHDGFKSDLESNAVCTYDWIIVCWGEGKESQIHVRQVSFW